MSEVMKPEKECPFDPKQYECHGVIAPVGSFSWALIQLKLRKLVARSVWSDKKMYLAITPRVNDLTVEKDSAYAVDGVAVGTKYDYLTHIDLRNEHGNFVPWQPTQEDMMACDWELKANIPDYTIVIDVTPYEVSKDSLWGGNTSETLVVIESNIDNSSITSIYWSARENGLPINLTLRDYDLLKDLVGKRLTITVDGIKYELGYRTERSDEPIYIPWYQGTEAEKVGNLLKQIGKTFRFYCNWHD
ncbi:DUF2829 domain-containing protein [Photorhabdus temperata]|uniref:DUF2829 domain-containing protein n=1 Tax=Photorhabdus temperata subsp. temperata Meg1 TaxID=1393735 RepID=A0A081RVK7_PHOTE|nr:DUF2829 domain-containing protein [Photorhabdus temperata]KER02710.1 Protein of unknown function (DUF2829) [Photorhabdus temperata subsp. temperata Meg1]MCT8349330.1 DUF2829 domain-containing protein [Photorhabdus temperata]